VRRACVEGDGGEVRLESMAVALLRAHLSPTASHRSASLARFALSVAEPASSRSHRLSSSAPAPVPTCCCCLPTFRRRRRPPPNRRRASVSPTESTERPSSSREVPRASSALRRPPRTSRGEFVYQLVRLRSETFFPTCRTRHRSIPLCTDHLH
jgi:hypothetical protein